MVASMSTHAPVVGVDVPVCGDGIAGTVSAMTTPPVMPDTGLDVAMVSRRLRSAGTHIHDGQSVIPPTSATRPKEHTPCPRPGNAAVRLLGNWEP
jgi:hypothetical protein